MMTAGLSALFQPWPAPLQTAALASLSSFTEEWANPAEPPGDHVSRPAPIDAGDIDSLTRRAAGDIDWRTFTPLARFDALIDAIGPRGMDRVADLLTNGTGSASLDLRWVPPLSLPLLPGLRLRVEFSSAIVAGLDTLSDIALLRPNASDSTRLSSSLAARRADATLRLRLRAVRETTRDEPRCLEMARDDARWRETAREWPRWHARAA